MTSITAPQPLDHTRPSPAKRRHGSESIDLVVPQVACRTLGLDEAALIGLVNTNRLAAYDLGGAIRFRRGDVYALARRLERVA